MDKLEKEDKIFFVKELRIIADGEFLFKLGEGSIKVTEDGIVYAGSKDGVETRLAFRRMELNPCSAESRVEHVLSMVISKPNKVQHDKH